MSEGAIAFEGRDGRAARVAYRRAGSRPAVVLIHGVGLQKAIWGPQVDALVTDHDVIAMDMPGHGGSSRPPEAPLLSDYSDAVLALLDGLGIGRAHVVGHSMGALVALEFALARPDRVAGVIAVNAVFCRNAAQRAAIAARVDELKDGENLPDWSGTLARWFGSPVPSHLAAAAEHTRALLADIDPVG